MKNILVITLWVLTFGVINLFDVGTNYPNTEQVVEIMENTIPVIVNTVENIIDPVLPGLINSGIENTIPIIIETTEDIIDPVVSAIINSGNIVGDIAVNGDIVQVIDKGQLWAGSTEEFKDAYEMFMDYKETAIECGWGNEAKEFVGYVDELNRELERVLKEGIGDMDSE